MSVQGIFSCTRGNKFVWHPKSGYYGGKFAAFWLPAVNISASIPRVHETGSNIAEYCLGFSLFKLLKISKENGKVFTAQRKLRRFQRGPGNQVHKIGMLYSPSMLDQGLNRYYSSHELNLKDMPEVRTKHFFRCSSYSNFVPILNCLKIMNSAFCGNGTTASAEQTVVEPNKVQN